MLQVFRARLAAGFVFLALGGCATIAPMSTALKDAPPPELPRKVELTGVPFYPQEDYYCGPAALAMALNAAGAGVKVEQMVEQVYLPERRGSLQVEMLAAARRNGMVAYQIEPRLDHILREVAAGTPVIVLENYGYGWFPYWHYSVVVGYDLERFEFIRRSGFNERQHMPLPVFEHVWQKDGHWAMVAVPPDRLPATAIETRYSSAIVALEKTGQLKTAHTAYATMLKRWPQSLIAMMGLGNTAYALGDLEGAEAAFRRAAQAHPGSAAALNNLAQTLADRGRLAAALAAAERAVKLGGPLLATSRATLEDIRRKQSLPH